MNGESRNNEGETRTQRVAELSSRWTDFFYMMKWPYPDREVVVRELGEILMEAEAMSAAAARMIEFVREIADDRGWLGAMGVVVDVDCRPSTNEHTALHTATLDYSPEIGRPVIDPR